ncbi:MAG: hypothetical protein R2939_01585 [Kofleriaceae bacterium]
MKTVIDHIPGTVSDFLDTVTQDAAATSAGEAVLAVALAEPSPQLRAKARALLASFQEPRLERALGTLWGRCYADSTETLADDLARLAEQADLDVPTLAFHLQAINPDASDAWQVCAPYLGEAYVRAEIAAALTRMPTVLQLVKALPAQRLFPILRELTNLTSLSFKVAEATPMIDLSHMTALTSLEVSGPVTDFPAACIAGLPLTSIELTGTEIDDLSGLATASALRWLKVRWSPAGTFPSAPWPELQSLELVRLRNLTRLPSLAQLTKLEELTLRDSPIVELPEDISACVELKNLTLSDLPITTLPEGLGALSLMELNLVALTLSSLPAWSGATSPEWVNMDMVEVTDPSPPTSAEAFLKLPSTAVVMKDLVNYLDHDCMAKGPRIQAAVDAWERGDDLRAAKIPELIVAISRAYRDDTYQPLADTIADKGGPLERAASALLPATASWSIETFQEHAARLASLDGFDPAAYQAFACEALGL